MDSNANPRLVEAYQQLADHTRPKCASCRAPFACCQPDHCETTRQMALELFGVALVETGHPRLPFMGESGCIVAPHMRPVCSVHTCGINAAGHDSDAVWDERYWKLRFEADELLFEHMERTE